MWAHAVLSWHAGVAQRDRAAAGSKPDGLDSRIGRLAGRRALDWLERCWNRCDAAAHAVGCWRSAGPYRAGVGDGTRKSSVAVGDVRRGRSAEVEGMSAQRPAVIDRSRVLHERSGSRY